MQVRSLAGAGLAAEGRVDTLLLHGSTGSSRARARHGRSLGVLRKLPRTAAGYEVLRAATRHRTSPGQPLAGSVTARGPAVPP
jgi:hypothetical protein